MRLKSILRYLQKRSAEVQVHAGPKLSSEEMQAILMDVFSLTEPDQVAARVATIPEEQLQAEYNAAKWADDIVADEFGERGCQDWQNAIAARLGKH